MTTSREWFVSVLITTESDEHPSEYQVADLIAESLTDSRADNIIRKAKILDLKYVGPAK